MWAYATATLRSAYRSPLSWVVGAAAVFLGWFGAIAAILALEDVGDQGLPLIFSTAQLAGVLLTLWLVGRSLEEDRVAGFAAAADATAPGPRGRLLGRWLGASLGGTALACVVGFATAISSALPSPPGLSLLSTNIIATALAGAWATLLAQGLRAGGAVLGTFALWVLGHLPWGTAPFLAGGAGRVVGALLPGPRDAGWADALGYTSAAVAGLLLGALALSRSSDS